MAPPKKPNSPGSSDLPVTLVVSEDEFLASAAVAQVRAPLVKAGYAVEERGGEDVQALLYALDTQSLFDAGRLVVVRDADALPAHAVDQVAAWAKAPPGGVRLVLVAAKGAKLKKALDGVATVVEAKAPPPWEVGGWVVRWVRGMGRTITPEAAQALVDALGTDLRDLATAAEQLATAVPGVIDEAAVSSLFRGLESQVWTFVDAVLDGERAAALRHLRALLAHGEHPIGLVAALARQLRTVAVVREDPRRPYGAVAKELGVKEGAVKRAARQARAFDDDRIRRAFRILAETDLSLKGGEQGEAGPPELLLEMAVADIAGRR